MRKVLLIATLSIFFVGCNVNPSKEGRIQKLEAEMQQAANTVHELENRVQALEVKNQQLEIIILDLEKK